MASTKKWQGSNASCLRDSDDPLVHGARKSDQEFQQQDKCLLATASTQDGGTPQDGTPQAQNSSIVPGLPCILQWGGGSKMLPKCSQNLGSTSSVDLMPFYLGDVFLRHRHRGQWLDDLPPQTKVLVVQEGCRTRQGVISCRGSELILE